MGHPRGSTQDNRIRVSGAVDGHSSDRRAQNLTAGSIERESSNSLVELDRLAANRAIARTIARMLWEHQRRRVEGMSGSVQRSSLGDRTRENA